MALAHCDELRVHLHAGPHAHQAIDDDGVARLESGSHHAQAVDQRAELHGAVLDFVVGAHEEHVAHASGRCRWRCR